MISRRRFLTAGGPWALASLAARGAFGAEDPALRLGQPRPFSFRWLRESARAQARKSYAAAAPAVPELLGRIDYDAVQKIAFRPDHALWHRGPGRFPVRFFHLHKLNMESVRIHVVSDGVAREIGYSPAYFDYGGLDVGQKLPPELGFSGFRIMDGRQKNTDWLAFQGASYFRSSGEDDQYGISARGIAINTALSTREEFPRFTEFWLSDYGPDSPSVAIYARLDGPSVTGAYKFVATKGHGAIVDVAATIYARKDVTRLGIAPLTSMYWYGENNRTYATDWRPEIHDSDGLAMWTGRNEHIWRPLINPRTVRTNSYLDMNPKGFGLMQRDRDFASYQDDGAFYNRRPGVWVEPQGDWGEGAVQLVEIPTRDEVHDNIVAFWQPKRKIGAGGAIRIFYRLYWRNDEPHPPANLGRVVATRIGQGGIPGQIDPKNNSKRKFVIDFQGGPLTAMAARYDVNPMITASRGKIDNAYVIRIVGTNRWRALFDLAIAGKEPIDLRCFLRLGDRTLTETWLYQYLP